ncbi:MAG: hypothetical protein AAF393_01705 [Pseudomonadota bacterium]
MRTRPTGPFDQMVVEAIPSRVVLHVGFHCTQMDAAHAFVRQNRMIVRRHAQFVLDHQLKPAVAAARGYSENPDPFNRQRFQFRFISLLGEVQAHEKRPLLISHPGLLGHMPGAGGVKSYAAAPDLCEDMVDGVHQVFRSEVEVLLLFTRCAPAEWLDLSWQRLTKNEMTEHGANEHANRFAQAADLVGVVETVRDRISGADVQDHEVTSLADAAFGVGGIYIDALRLPPRSFEKIKGPEGSAPAAEGASMATLMEPYRTPR